MKRALMKERRGTQAVMVSFRTMLKGKIHRATITGASPNHVGSITIDRNLMDAANILEYEQVQIVDVTNGVRFETYAVAGEPGSGVVQVNGAAARQVQVGAKVVIMNYGMVEEPVPMVWEPRLVHVDENNQAVSQSEGRLVVA